MNILKEKITKEIINCIDNEANSAIDFFENEKEKYKHGSKKISKFNYFKINYENFKNKDITLNKFLLNVFLSAFPFILLNIMIFNSQGYENLNASQLLPFIGAISFSNIMIFILTYMSKISNEKTIAKEKLENATNNINNIKNEIKIIKEEISNVFNKEINLDKIFDLSCYEDKKIAVFDRPISAFLIKKLEQSLNEDQIISIFKKSKSNNITYKGLIEIINEIEFNEKAKNFYKEIFKCNDNKGDKLNKKIKCEIL